MSDFGPVHDALRRIMIEAAPNARVVTDRPGDLVLNTSEVDPKSGKPVWFGAVTTKKSYVAYHLFPLYHNPDLISGLSVELSRRRQGRTCFNFRTVDGALFDELAVLTRTAAGPLA